MRNIFIAHKRKLDGKQQSLSVHLTEVAELAANFSNKVGVENSGRLIGLLHDFGKYSKEFQTYIKSATGDIDQDDEMYVNATLLKGKIDHSTAGAQLTWRLLRKYGKNAARQGEIGGQILALCISRLSLVENAYE